MALRLTVPNILSASRIFMLPVLFLLLYFGHDQLFLITYILTGSTDYFDGRIARKYNLVSHFGKELDSLADLFFYISSAYFLSQIQPAAIAANRTYLIVFFSLLAFSFILSGLLFRRPMMMHTIILRWNAVLVYFVIIASFFFDTTIFVRLIILFYIIGFIEEILIFIFFGQVDPDSRSILHLIRERKKAA